MEKSHELEISYFILVIKITGIESSLSTFLESQTGLFFVKILITKIVMVKVLD